MGGLDGYYPGVMEDLVNWLKMYKTSDGKGVNELGNHDRPISVGDAKTLINECNDAWKEMCKKGKGGRGGLGFSLSGECLNQ